MTNQQNILPWNDYSSFVRRKFGNRVQKISINAGFTCPNRDGKISTDGCIYCTNKSFSPFYCNPNLSITEQLLKGIDFFKPKYNTQFYFAYFQSYTNTYADINSLKKMYLEALSVEGVVGLIIATRPDCISEDILIFLSEISKDKYVEIEYGLESTKNDTLKFINRGHTYQQTIDAIELTHKYNVPCGLHLILGLPYETKTDFIEHAREISKLPINTLKLHQMQVLKGTKLEQLYDQNPDIITNLSLPNYVQIIADFLDILNPDIIIERFTSESPRNLLIYPDWNGKKNFEITHIIDSFMKKNGLFQGRNYLR